MTFVFVLCVRVCAIANISAYAIQAEPKQSGHQPAQYCFAQARQDPSVSRLAGWPASLS